MKRATDDSASGPPAKKAKLAAPQPDDGAAAAYLAEHQITVHEKGAPAPCLSFASAPFQPELVALLRAQPGFTVPSAVQASTWPIAAIGRDVLAIAKTGSGKTLGFLMPVLARCMRERAPHFRPTANGALMPAAKGAPLALIMAPTRELGLQIAAEALKFGQKVNCRAVAVYGGAARDQQVRGLQKGCELIIGTPGRISDVLGVKSGGRGAVCSVASLSMLVLDEADRMLDMGFERDIRRIVWQAFGERARQTFLYSATWPLTVQGVAGDLMTNPVKVSVGAGGEKLTASTSVLQRVHVVQNARERWDAFVKLIAPFGARGGGAHAGKRVIVFANMKRTVQQVAEYCRGKGMACDCLSGDRSQSQRESTIRKFKAGSINVVVATDVAARGLDIKGIERVINYELPLDDFQDYVHRIGRTGRAGATGEADSLFGADSNSDRGHAPELARIMEEAGQEIPPALAKMTSNRTTFADSDSE